ncbi:MAG TPA: NAD(P)/FAD-dependent oxidoreductase [Thermoleophilaceae bacterium]|jgi:2-polyprenyl-6-methoxyphenol hydroxylase-like FAD-dependent oxidoreductase
MPGERFDVVIVGARCAGSPLATLLARSGLRVAVVEQVTFPRTVLSSHLIEADSLNFFKRLGILDPVRKTGVRFMHGVDTRLNELRLVTRFPLRPGDLGGAAFLRRHLLDSILADAAAEAGAEMRMDTKVVGLLEEAGRVTGVRVVHDGRESELHAPLVVGADGRKSTVARLCGARRYNVTRNERSYYFTFFEGASPDSDDLFVFHRWDDRMVWAGAADSGLYLVGVSPEDHQREDFRRDPETNLMAHMRACEPTAAALADARRATKIFGIVRFEGYFREPTGPGWVLVGDAGHFKDPAAGRGIGDAFIQAERLAPTIVAGLDGTGPPLDLALAEWAAWRDRKFAGHYWMTNDLGCAGAIPTMAPQLVQALEGRGEVDRFFDLFSHRSCYYDILTIPRLAEATGRVLVKGRFDRAAVVREAGRLLVREGRRRWINTHPDFEPPEPPDARPRSQGTGDRVAAAARPFAAAVD